MRTMAIIKSTAIYSSLLLVVYMLFLGVSPDDIRDALNASTPSLAQWFVSVSAVAIPVLVVVLALHSLWIWLKLHTVDRDRTYTTFEVFIGGIGYALRGPFSGPSALVVNRQVNDLNGLLRRKSQAGSVIHLVFSLALLAYIASGCFVVWHAYR